MVLLEVLSWLFYLLGICLLVFVNPVGVENIMRLLLSSFGLILVSKLIDLLINRRKK